MADWTIAWNRFGLGGRADDIAPQDAKRWLLSQFDGYDPRPSLIAERTRSAQAVREYRELRAAQRELRQKARAEGMDMNAADGNSNYRDQRRQMRQGVRRDHLSDVASRGQVAIESSTPFMERMVHFWSNHFAVSVAKNQVRSLAGPYEFDAIRPNILGSFGDLLKASVLHPAMLIYLDQAQSIGPNSRIAERVRRRRNREIGINENLAREILELHTLGVRTGYTQEDVTEFARALTGWTLSGQRRFRDAIDLPNGTAFSNMIHEPGRRTILGNSFAANAGQQALRVLDMLATHPATAKHIATKLARHFATDEPPPAMVARLENAFLESGGDLPTVYRALINSPEAWIAEPRKFRQPWEWAIATYRATNADIGRPRRFFTLMRELAQPVWGPTSPAGYSDTMESWAGPDALIRRVEAAQRLASRNRTTGILPLPLARELFGDTLNDSTATAIRRAESADQGLALLLASPEMMRR